MKTLRTFFRQLLHAATVTAGVGIGIVWVVVAIAAAVLLASRLHWWPSPDVSVEASVQRAALAMATIYAAIAIVSIYLYLEILERSWSRLTAVACGFLASFAVYNTNDTGSLSWWWVGAAACCFAGGAAGWLLRRGWRRSRWGRAWRAGLVAAPLRYAALGVRGLLLFASTLLLPEACRMLADLLLAAPGPGVLIAVL